MSAELEGIGYSFTFVDVAADRTDLMTVGVVPWAAWVERVTMVSIAGETGVQMSAAPLWLPDMRGLAGDVDPEGERLLGGRGRREFGGEGRRMVVYAAKVVVTYEVGKLVRWYPWYLRVAFRNFAVGLGQLDGVVYMRRAVSAEAVMTPARRNGEWRDPRQRVWGLRRGAA